LLGAILSTKVRPVSASIFFRTNMSINTHME
jgi:hypothetical protein